MLDNKFMLFKATELVVVCWSSYRKLTQSQRVGLMCKCVASALGFILGTDRHLGERKWNLLPKWKLCYSFCSVNQLAFWGVTCWE